MHENMNYTKITQSYFYQQQFNSKGIPSPVARGQGLGPRVTRVSPCPIPAWQETRDRTEAQYVLRFLFFGRLAPLKRSVLENELKQTTRFGPVFAKKRKTLGDWTLLETWAELNWASRFYPLPSTVKWVGAFFLVKFSINMR